MQPLIERDTVGLKAVLFPGKNIYQDLGFWLNKTAYIFTAVILHSWNVIDLKTTLKCNLQKDKS